MKVESGSIGCEARAERGEQLSHCDPADVVALLREHGCVFFSGFRATLDEFTEFTARFGYCADPREVHYPPGGEPLGFHAEDAYNPYRPDAIWFLCLFEGSDGGAPTGVIDGVRLLAELDSQWQDFCSSHELRFDRHWAPGTWQAAVGGDRRDEVSAVLDTLPGLRHHYLADGTLCTSYRAPLVVVTPGGAESFSNTVLQAVTEPTFYGMSLADGSPVPEELVAEANRLALAQELPLGWRAGELAVIDNSRMMHRRAEYTGTDRDLRARHCEDLFGTELPFSATPLTAAVKRLLQSDEGSPIAVGPVEQVA